MMSYRKLFSTSIRLYSSQIGSIRQITRSILPVNSFVVQPLEKKQGPLCTCPVYSKLHSEASIKKQEGYITRIKKSFGLGKPKLRYSKKHLAAAGTTMFSQYLRYIDNIEIMKELDLPDTFNSYFLVAELHVWMLMARLAREGEEGKLVRNGLVKSFWTELGIRGKTLEGSAFSDRKQAFNLFNDHFYTALFTYDEGLIGNDRMLACAVWQMLFEKREVDAEKLAQAVEYVRRQMQFLEEMDSNVLLGSGMIKLLPFFPDKVAVESP